MKIEEGISYVSNLYYIIIYDITKEIFNYNN